MYNRALCPSDLTSSQFSTCGELAARHDDLPTMQRLADILALDCSTRGHNLRPLGRDRLITLQAGEGDERRRHALLTEAGRERLEKARPLWAEAQTKFEMYLGAGLSHDLRATLLRIGADPRPATA